MRNLLMLAIVSCVLAHGLCRPAQAADNGDSEIEDVYESGEGPDDDNAVSANEASQAAEQEQAVETDGEDEESQAEDHAANAEPASLRATGDEKPTANRYKFSGFKSGRKIGPQHEKPDTVMDSSSEYEVQAKQCDSSTLRENSKPIEKLDETQRVFNRDANDFKLIQSEENQGNRKTLESRTTPYEEGRFLFESLPNLPGKDDKHGYNNENADSSDISLFLQPYRKTVQAGSKAAGNEKGHKYRRFHLNRDRRNTKEESKDDNNSMSAPDADEMDIGNEEAAIKRHVQKLSSQEFDELLNSLSDDKRELLKTIMGSDSGDKDNIEKREITKKAGLLQENSNVDSGQSDVGKLQDGNAADINTESSPSTPAPSSNKVPETSEMNELAVTKTSEASNGSSVSTDSVAQVNQQKADTSETALISDSFSKGNESPNAATGNTDTKIENKREANLKDSDDSNLKDNEQDDVSSQDEDLSELLKDETRLHEENKNMFKREASEYEGNFADSIRSLEESFPKPKSYDESDPYSGSDLAPLIRVKRQNSVVLQKRGAAMVPEAKVAYFPYRAEKEDEDSEEGSEFSEDGFFDRVSNRAQNVEYKSLEDGPAATLSKSGAERSYPKDTDTTQLTENENIETDRSLGSDTDSVLSGVEGVDDNLMFSSGTRNRRGFEKKPTIEGQAKNNEANSRSIRSTPFMENEMKTATENYISASYLPIESDAFGALPRNYDGELGRYKRVRRVKQPQKVDSFDT